MITSRISNTKTARIGARRPSGLRRGKVLGVREPGAEPRPRERARAAMGLRHLGRSTEEACVGWMRSSWDFCGRRDPAGLGAAEVSALLSSLATERRVAAATQNQALAALLFLFREVLGAGSPLARRAGVGQGAGAAAGRHVAGRSALGARAHGRCATVDGDPDVRCRPEIAVSTTMTCTHVRNCGPAGVLSPADRRFEGGGADGSQADLCNVAAVGSGRREVARWVGCGRVLPVRGSYAGVGAAL
jgi:hypothetical protein